MLSYIFKRYKDTYTLKNTGLVSLSYSLSKVYCGESTLIEDGTVVAGATQTITFEADSRYEMVVTDGTESMTITFMWYNKLLNSIIRDAKDVLCGCTCSTCDECDSCEDRQHLVNKILSYVFLTRPQYDAYLEVVANYMRCRIDEMVLCLLAGETITGESDSDDLAKEIIAIYYTAFYLAALSIATDQEEIEYIQAKYRSSKIFTCMKKMGIDINELEEITSNMATFTVNSGAYINKPPSEVGDNTIAVANRATTVLTLAMFTSQTTPPYADPENDPVLNLRVDSIAGTNVGVFQYNGNPITPGQVIPASGISAGNLVHVSPDQNGVASDKFMFSLSDTGSQQYTS